MSNDANKTIPAAYSEGEKAFNAELDTFFGGKWGAPARCKTVEMPAPLLEALKEECRDE